MTAPDILLENARVTTMERARLLAGRNLLSREEGLRLRTDVAGRPGV
jgi:hypothetical protein